MFASFASPILLSDTNIDASTATDEDCGGGGMAIYSTQIALYQVKVTNCKAGTGGGGGILLNGQTEGHLFDCAFTTNAAASSGSGGNIRVVASSLIVYGKNFNIQWPLQEPALPIPIFLSSKIGTSMLKGDASVSGGDVSCMGSLSEKVLILNPEENAVCQTNIYKSITQIESCVAENTPGWICSSTELTSIGFFGSSCTKFLAIIVPEDIIKSCSEDQTLANCEMGGYFYKDTYFSKQFVDEVFDNCKLSFDRCASSTQYVCPSKGIFFGKGTTLQDSTADDSGGGLHSNICAIEMSGTTITNAVSKNGDGGAVWLSSGSTLKVTDGTKFESNKALKGSGGALSCQNCNLMDFSGGTVFQNNVAKEKGGAIEVTSPKNPVQSQNSVFKSNTAQNGNGGAVDSYHGTWTSTGDLFKWNTAGGSGGAISSTGSKKLTLTLTYCTENSAPKGGGGCIIWEPEAKNSDDPLWESLKPVHPDLSSEYFTSSSASTSLYGQIIATPAKSLRLVSMKEMTTNDAQILFPLYPEVQLLDLYDQVIKGASVENLEITAILSESSASLRGASIAKVDLGGVASFKELGLQGTPGTGPHKMKFEAVLTDSTKRFLTTMDLLSTMIQVCGDNLFLPLGLEQCESCPVNSVLKKGIKTGKRQDVCSCNSGFYIQVESETKKTTCVKCPLETQSLEGSTSPKDCKCNKGLYAPTDFTCVTCPPEKSVCEIPGLSAPKTASGWWRANFTSSNLTEYPFYKCLPKRCNGNVNGSNTSCKVGYDETGPKCSTCAPKYIMTDSGCTPCPSRNETSSAGGGLVALMIFCMLLYMFGTW